MNSLQKAMRLTCIPEYRDRLFDIKYRLRMFFRNVSLFEKHLKDCNAIVAGSLVLQSTIGVEFEGPYTLKVFLTRDTEYEALMSFIEHVEKLKKAKSYRRYTHLVPPTRYAPGDRNIPHTSDIQIWQHMETSSFSDMYMCNFVATFYKSNGCRVQVIEMQETNHEDYIEEFYLSGLKTFYDGTRIYINDWGLTIQNKMRFEGSILDIGVIHVSQIIKKYLKRGFTIMFYFEDYFCLESVNRRIYYHGIQLHYEEDSQYVFKIQ